MDSITRSHYETQLELAFLKKRGEEFQSWFSSVMSKRYPADGRRLGIPVWTGPVCQESG